MKYILNYFNKVPLWLALVFNSIVGFLLSPINFWTFILINGFFSTPEFSEILTGCIVRLIGISLCIALNFCLYKKNKKKKIQNKSITRGMAIFRFLLTIFIFLFFTFSFFYFSIIF